jgi:hypothetical protein
MDSGKRRQSSAPCCTCSLPIKNDQDIVYCSMCGEQYHKDCWVKNNNRCKVNRCRGESYNLWLRIEPKLLDLLQVKNSKLLHNCPNCANKISPLDRYCSSCGHDVNRPDRQGTFRLYPFAKWLRQIRRLLYFIALVIGMFFTYQSSIYLVSAAQGISESVNVYYTEHAPTKTSTSLPDTPTSRPTWTFTALPSTPTLRPTRTFTALPSTSTTIPTYTPRPTATLTPSPTKILTPSPTKLVAFVTFNSTNKSAPVTINFSAENSYLEYEDGAQKMCYKLGCEYKWAFPDGVGYDFPSASIMPFRFTRSGTFKGYVTVCWQGICGDTVFSITIK